LQQLAVERGERIELARLLEVFGDRAFGALMLVLAIPNLILLPPGASTIFGVPLIIIAAQLALGYQSVWLPRRVRRWSVDRSVLVRMVERGTPYLRRVERLLAPRYGFLLGPMNRRLIGFGCFLLAILIALPIPFANFLSGLSISAFALALLQRDGVAAALGWGFALVSAGATALVSGAAWLLGKEMFDAASRLL
jgi:hypothetical protein